MSKYQRKKEEEEEKRVWEAKTDRPNLFIVFVVENLQLTFTNRNQNDSVNLQPIQVTSSIVSIEFPVLHQATKIQ